MVFCVITLKVNWSVQNFFLNKCVLSSSAQINSFYNSIMLSLQVITPQMFYDVIYALHWNVSMDPWRCPIPGVTMAEDACSSFSIKIDSGCEVCSPVNGLRGISEYYSMLTLTAPLLLCLFLVTPYCQRREPHRATPWLCQCKLLQWFHWFTITTKTHTKYGRKYAQDM